MVHVPQHAQCLTHQLPRLRWAEHFPAHVPQLHLACECRPKAIGVNTHRTASTSCNVTHQRDAKARGTDEGFRKEK